MTMRKTSTKLLKPREAAERCGVKPRTVVRWIREGRLQGVKMNGRNWRVDEQDLAEFIAAQPVGPE